MSTKILLNIKVLTNSSRNEIVGWQNNFLKIKIKAQREKGKANLELINLLAKFLDISKNRIRLINGKTCSLKILSIQTSFEHFLNRLLQAGLPAPPFEL